MDCNIARTTLACSTTSRLFSSRARQYHLQVSAPLMPQVVARGAERDQILDFVATTLGPRHNMMNVQMPRVVAAFAAALVAVPGLDFAPDAGRNGSGVSLARDVDFRVAAGCFVLGFSEG